MHVAARVDHAISAALVLPEPSEEPMSGAVLSERIGVSYTYLMTIIASLKKAGLARVQRGTNGGLSLARSASDITVAEVIWAVDDPFDMSERSRDTASPETTSWSRLPQLWVDAHDAVHGVFSQVPLAQLRCRRHLSQQH